jgi:hypothetical protein
MSYLLLRMWGSLLLAMLFGLWFGWLIWGSLVRRLRRELAQARQTSYEIIEDTAHQIGPAIEIETPKTMAAAAGFSGDATLHESPRENLHEDQRENLRPVLDSLFEPLDPAAVAQRAFEISQQRGFQNGTEQEDWLRAERQLHNERMQAARDRLKTE